MYNCIGVSSIADLLGLGEDVATPTTPTTLRNDRRNLMRRARRNSESDAQREERLKKRRVQRRLSESQMETGGGNLTLSPLTPTNVDCIRRERRNSQNEERLSRRRLELSSRRLCYGTYYV